jgi:hypothetical protein
MIEQRKLVALNAAIRCRQGGINSNNIVEILAVADEFEDFLIRYDSEVALSLAVDNSTDLTAKQIVELAEIMVGWFLGHPKAIVNPWMKSTWNATRQAKILKESPVFADKLMRAAKEAEAA